MARPLLSLYVPELTGLHQPLSGEFAGRRDVLEQLPFVEGWGVEIAMLVDLAQRHGAESIAQVDLGVRRHRHRSLHELSVQAAEVTAALLSRVKGAPPLPPEPSLTRADGSVLPLNLAERPPLASLRRSDFAHGRPTRSRRIRRSDALGGVEALLVDALRRRAAVEDGGGSRHGSASVPASASRTARHTRSDVHGMSRWRTPRWARASMTAFCTAGVEPIVAASPMPLAPSGLSGVGVSVERTSKLGSSAAVGMP